MELDFPVVSFPVQVFIVALLLFVLVLSILYLNDLLMNGSHRYPPMARMTNQDVTKYTVNGTIHRYFLQKATELGPVFRVPQELIMEAHYICCDSALARIVLEGDKSLNIPPGIKREQVKILNKLTLDTPNILTKQTHGEGYVHAYKI